MKAFASPPAGALLVLLAATGATNPDFGADWHQFQGPHRTGVSDERDLLRDWPLAGPPVLWSVDVGPGFAGSAIRDGEVYILDRAFEEADILRCFDLQSGNELWRFRYSAPGRLSHAGSRTVPIVDEERVYTVGPFGHVYCLSRQTHEELWHISLTQSYETDPPRWGYTQNTILHGDLLYVAPMTESTGLIALNKRSGEIVWETGAIGRSHSSPVLVKLHRRLQLLFLSVTEDRTGLLSSFDPDTGAVLWEYRDYHQKIPIPAPTMINQNSIFLTGGYDAGSVLFDVVRKKNRYTFREIFRTPLGSQIHLPVFFENHLYFLANENRNQRRDRYSEGGLTCLNLDGSVVWRTGNSPNFGRGNMIFADKMLIILDGINGTLRLVEPSPVGYRQIAEAAVFNVAKPVPPEKVEDQKMWAPMALSEGRLVLRSQNILKCIDLRRN